MKKFLTILKTVSLFEGIDESDLQSLLSCLCAKTESFDKKQIVFMNGDSAEKVGIVLSGQVQVVKEDYYGNTAIVGIVNVGGLFGETFACADIKILPVSVITTTESEILFIDYRKIINQCNNSCSFHSKLIYNMMKILAMKNIMLNQKIELISKKTTREKLLAFLYSTAKKTKSNTFTIEYNRQELANYLSVDRSAMSAELCKMRDEGILKFNKSQFELLMF